MVTDPIADLLTRIRNAHARGKESVDVNFSRLGASILSVLKTEGYVYGYNEVDFSDKNQVQSKKRKGSKLRKAYRVNLKYYPNGEPSIKKSTRVSSPGRRVYAKASAINPVRSGLGITILSTSKGVMTNREAVNHNVGGEVLAEIY